MIYLSLSVGAPLYHHTSLYASHQIVMQNEMAAKSLQHVDGRVERTPYGDVLKDYKDVYGVSLTRDKRYVVAGQTYFVLDQQKLRTRFKIRPLSYWHVSQPDKRRIESEEFVVGPIKPVIPYIIKLCVNQRKIDLLYRRINSDVLVDDIRKYIEVEIY